MRTKEGFVWGLKYYKIKNNTDNQEKIKRFLTLSYYQITKNYNITNKKLIPTKSFSHQNILS